MILITFLVSIICANYVRAGVNVGLSHNLNLCLDAQLSPRWQMQNGLHVQGWQCSDSDNQQITLRNDRSVAFGREQRFCMDVKDGVFAPGTSVIYWDCYSGSPNQIWNYLGSGVFQSASHPEFCLDVTDGRFVNGVFMQLYYCNEQNPNQVFSVGGRIGSSSAVSSGNSGNGGIDNNLAFFKNLFKVKRGISWALDDRLYSKLAAGPMISFLSHWEHGNVAGNQKLYLLQFWGSRKTNEWRERLNEMRQSGWVPPVVLSFNEPDLAIDQNSQASAGMNPYFAADLHKKEIDDVFRPMGTKIVTPQFGSTWGPSEDYIKIFMNRCRELGCHFDAAGIHHYETMKDGVDAAVRNTIANVERAYEIFRLPLIITELGFDKAGGGSDAQFKEYLQKVGKYLDNTDKVVAWSLSACQKKNSGGWGNDMQADGTYFMNDNFAFYNADGSLTDLAYQYMYDTF